MKKVLLSILTILMCISLVGCGKDTKEENKKEPTSTKAKYEYTYKEGVLTPIVDDEGKPKQNDFVLNGLILIGNRHAYDGLEDTTSIVESFVKKGYKKEGLNSSFYLNEYIGFYLDTDYNKEEADIKVLAIPHKTVEEMEKMSSKELEDLATEKGFIFDYQKPDKENYGLIGEAFISIDYPPGKYDILFTYKGKVAYFINVDLSFEPTE